MGTPGLACREAPHELHTRRTVRRGIGRDNAAPTRQNVDDTPDDKVCCQSWGHRVPHDEEEDNAHDD